MSHPTIVLEESPATDCPLPAYNSIKYCFRSTDFELIIGTKATFSIELSNPLLSIIPPSTGFFEVAGFSFNTGTANLYNTLDTSAAYTKLEFAQNLLEMFTSNDYFFQNYTFAVVADALVATARENAIQPNFNFGYSNFPVSGNPIVNSEANGTIDEDRPNYRIVVQIWECENGIPANLISKEAYQVDSNGGLCIDIASKVAPLLSTRFVHDLPFFVAYHSDEQIVKRFCVRYGELYSDSLSVCGTESKTFVFADEIRAYNAAFQRDEQVLKNDIVCQPEFMTNTPDFTTLCEDSIAYLWINAYDIFVTPAPANTTVNPVVDFFYTDGTTSSWRSTQLIITPNGNKIFAVAAGFKSWESFADPLKKVDYWRMQIVVRDTSVAPADETFYASQYFKLVSCCEGDVEFIFLNEYGAYDTIQFTQVDAVEFQSSNAVFESFLDPSEENALRGGKDVVDLVNDNIITVTSKFVNDYKSLNWIEEFLNSPKKYIRAAVNGQEKKINKVLVQVDGVEYAKKDDNSIYLRLQYTINESLNHQRN